MAADSGNVDSGTPSDAGPSQDAGANPDAGAGADGGAVADAGASPDAGFFPPPDCVQIDRAKVEGVVPPAGLQVKFRVLDCDGNPVRPLVDPSDDATSNDVILVNDETGQAFNDSSEGGSAGGVGVESDIELFSVLLLDLSSSIYNATNTPPGLGDDHVIDGALEFVNQVVTLPAGNLKHQVALSAFGATANTEVLVNFTSNDATLISALEDLRTNGTPRGSTNLYGAYVDGIDLIESMGTPGAVIERFVVLMTDGTHEAGDLDNLRNQALQRKNGAAVTFYSIGVAGDYDACKIEELAGGGNSTCREGTACVQGTVPPATCTQFITVDETGELAGAFQAVSAKAVGIARSNYVVGVCTPVELGSPTLTLQVDVDGATDSATVGYDTSFLTGDLLGCNAEQIAEGQLDCSSGGGTSNCSIRCLNMECGTDQGYACGTCQGSDYCETSTNTCEDACNGGVLECGIHNGVDCGTCAPTEFCQVDSTCQDACNNGALECGMHNGVDCGTCALNEECAADYTCVVPCDGMQCGTDFGQSCGTCMGTDFCDVDNTCQPTCVTQQCGLDHGVDCGTCSMGFTCEGGTCVDPCATNPCQNGGTCDAAINGYQCTCQPGFDGADCAFPVNFCAGPFTVTMDEQSSVDQLAGCTTITGNVTFEWSTSDMVDYSGLRSISAIGGDFTIDSSLLTWNDLSPMAGLRQVDGSFNITGGNGLNTLAGLEHLRTVGGTLDFGTSTYSLEDGRALDGLESVGGSLTIEIPLISFASLQSVGGAITLDGTPKTSGGASGERFALSGFNALTNFSGRIDISEYASVSGFSAVTGSVGDVAISTLGNIGGFDLVQSAGTVSLEGAAFSAFPSLTSVAYLDLNGAPPTEVLLPELQSVVELLVTGTTSLQTLNLPKLESGRVWVYQNTDLQHVSLPMLNPSSVTIGAHTVSFVENPALQTVDLSGAERAWLTINGNTNLTSLILTGITRIRLSFFDNAAFPAFGNMALLTTVENDFFLDNNYSLQNLDAFADVSVVDTDVTISNNQSLVSINGFAGSATAVNGDILVEWNPSLATMDGFLGLATSADGVQFVANPLLAQCEIDAFSAQVMQPCNFCSGNDNQATCN
jgi:hypothetical protein